MALAEEMRIKLVNVVKLFAANVAFPWITFAVTALMQEVQCLVGELDAAEQTLQHPFAHLSIRARRCYCTVRCGGSR